MSKFISRFFGICTLFVLAVSFTLLAPVPTEAAGGGGGNSVIFQESITWDNIYTNYNGAYRSTGEMTFFSHHVGSAGAATELYSYHSQGSWEERYIKSGQLLSQGWWKTPVGMIHIKRGQVASEQWVSRGAGWDQWVGSYSYRVVFHIVDGNLVVYHAWANGRKVR